MNFAHSHPNVKGYFPGLASEWAIDRPNHTVYVRLDPEARWSDGEPITADDVLFMFYFYQSPYNNAPWYQDFYKVQYSRVTRYDERTFAITVAEAKPDFEQYALELTPEPRQFFKGYADDFVSYYQWKVRPTTGAYTILEKDIQKGKSIAMTRVKDWWAKDRKFWRYRFNPDAVRLEVIRDPDKAFEVFSRGDLDMFGMSLAKYNYEKLPDDAPLVQNGYIQKATFWNQVPRSGLGLWLNTSKKPLDDRDVRLGLQHAMNWDLVIKEFFRGDWSREQTTSDGYGELSNREIRSREYSVPEAEESFKKAGYSRGSDGIFVNEAGQRLSFNLSTGYSTMKDALTILEREARKAGVELKLEVLDGTAGFKKVQEKQHEIALTGFSYSTTEVYPRYWETWHGVNAYNEDGSVKVQTNNLTVTAIPELDGLIDQYRGSESHDEKVKLAHEMEQIIHDDAAYIPGVYRPLYKVAYWRWIRWPADFNVARSESAGQYFVHWIDPEMREETKAAMRDGKKFEPQVLTFDQFKTE